MSILGQFQFRRDVLQAWASANPILLDGEMGIESDTDNFKIGDGVTAWNMLPYGGIKGDTGATGDTGPMGNNGWSPILANVTDGERRVLRLIDWTGGTGTKPAVPTDNYIGPAGFTNLAGATDIRGATGATGPQGPAAIAFRSVTGNTGTATAEVADDTLAITGGTGISTAATDTPDGLVITNTGVTQFNGRTGAITPQQADYDAFFTTPAEASAAAPVQSVAAGAGIAVETVDGNVTVINADRGSTAVAAHEAAANPHGQYLTQTEADALYQPAGQSAGPQMLSSVHSATQANTTVTPADLTGQVFTLPPGKTMRVQGNLIFTGAATTTGAFYGFRVAHGAGANGNVQGSWNAEVAITSAAAATGLADGDSVNVAGGATAASGILGTATVAGNNSAWIMLTLTNRSTNANATVALQFRSEVANSAVTAQIGTSAVAIIG